MNSEMITGLPNEEKELWHLETIQRAALLISVFTLAIGLFLWPTVEVGLGLAGGSLIGILNFRFLKRIVTKIIDEGVNDRRRNMIRFVVKLVALILLVGFLILVAKVNPLAFVVGFSSIVLAIFYEGMKSLF